MKLVYGTLLTVCLVACSSAPAPVDSTPYRVTESASALDIQLVRDGQLAGQLLLERGRFEIPEQDGLVADGRRLVVTLGTHTAEHVSAGNDPLQLPLSSDTAEMRAFALAPIVTEALARWNIAFVTSGGPGEVFAATTGDEVPYSCGYTTGGTGGTPCGGCTYGRSSSCGSTSCNEWPSGAEKMEFVICSTSLSIVRRTCTTANSTSTCGTTGPLGCAVCWSTYELDCGATYTTTGGYCAWHDGLVRQ